MWHQADVRLKSERKERRIEWKKGRVHSFLTVSIDLLSNTH